MTDSNILEQLCDEHSKTDFNCEEEQLTLFIKMYAKQKHLANLSKTYVLPDKNKKVLAYITIAFDTVDLKNYNELSRDMRSSAKDSIPVVYLLMLARDLSLKGQHIGHLLLKEAMKLTYKASKIAGIKGMFLTAANSTVAEKFYDKIKFLTKILKNTIDNEPVIVYYVPIKQIEAIVLDADSRHGRSQP